MALGPLIVGGESGPGARTMHPEWAAHLRNQCEAAQVPFLFKQWGEWLPAQQATLAQKNSVWDRDDCFVRLDGATHWIDRDDHEPFEASDSLMLRVGKKAAGRLLDGREWNGVPS